MGRMVWLLCPVCGNKTRLKVYQDTELINFPLYCPKCKQETSVNVKKAQLSVIRVKTLFRLNDFGVTDIMVVGLARRKKLDNLAAIQTSRVDQFKEILKRDRRKADEPVRNFHEHRLCVYASGS